MMLELLTVASITILAVISPGADFAMVTRNSMMLSRRAGMLTAAGIALGVLVHVAYSLLGLGLVISRSALLFNLIKYLGAAYLVWLGIGMLRAVPSGPGASPVAPLSDLGALRRGFLTNATNPKTTLFVVSLFSQVVSPRTPLAVQIGYGAFRKRPMIRNPFAGPDPSERRISLVAKSMGPASVLKMPLLPLPPSGER